ncbi:hypothetical protein U5817_10070 [Aromatoleum evansii]|uniref:Uncharacterized protein n=1 Tax=Aromatoleum evansii TaxID=59406 RepID=A0ABZ1AW81_AROEV|nr:hypothetical protein U5817_09720 [Aromatoleum evansii]WRL48373.1 hypothetical protein U5817_10070 [Aromatoleum evansii]
MSLSNYTEAAILSHLLRATAWPKPLALYVALFTADPGETGSLAQEVTGGSYARVACGPSDATWNLPVGGDTTFTNAAAVTFPAPTAAWGDVTHFGICDASTGGICLASGALDTPTTIGSGAPATSFAAGELRLVFSGHLSDALIEAIGTHLLRTGEWTAPAAIFAGLLTSVAGAGLGAEVAGADYVRKAIGPSTAAWTAPTDEGGSGNADYVQWASPTTDWIDAEKVILADALTAGNTLLTIPLAAVRTLPLGALPPNFPPGALKVVAN